MRLSRYYGANAGTPKSITKVVRIHRREEHPDLFAQPKKRPAAKKKKRKSRKP